MMNRTFLKVILTYVVTATLLFITFGSITSSALPAMAVTDGSGGGIAQILISFANLLIRLILAVA